jgi:DNA-binding ferritin-like protein (Dps family)
MINLLTRILGDKKEWKAMAARADALPRDYQAVYDEMKGYMSEDGTAPVEADAYHRRPHALCLTMLA